MVRNKRDVYKKRINIKKVIIAITILLLLIIGIFFLINKGFKNIKETIVLNDYYIASDSNKITIYTLNEETGLMEETDNMLRGTKVKSNDKTINDENIKYIEIVFDDKIYYVEDGILVKNEKDVVKETVKYVRTSVTVYKNEKDSKILSFVKKGKKLEIIDYDYLDKDGNVNMYKIKYEDIEGWVYQKYLSNTETEALENYNENGVYDTHKDRKYSRELYGGQASTLDYYPYEKVEFENNPLLKNAKSMYLNGSSQVISNVDKYLEIATTSGVNAIVVDIKDGALAYPSEIAKEYSMTAYNTAMNKLENYKSAVKKIKDAGIYVIGRIVVFNDYHFGKDHPEECIKSPVSSRLWPSAYSRLAWEYNVELAKEAVDVMGFNEIQFDYVRFPEDAYNMSKS